MMYQKPYIPKGCIHIGGEWSTGFVIENSVDKSQYTWIPLGVIPGFLESFENCEEEFEEMDMYLIKNSIIKYGGIYFSTYPMSYDCNSKSVSIEKEKYTTLVSFKKAKFEAVNMSKTFEEVCNTHLPYEWEYENIIKCVLLLTEDKNFDNGKFALYDLNKLWIWTMKKHGPWAAIVKKYEADRSNEEVYANTDFVGYKEIGFRTVLVCI